MRLKKLLYSDVLFYGLFSVVILTLTIFPLYTKAKITPAGYTFTGAQFKIRDYFIYTAIMRQGHSQWLMEDTTAISDEVIKPNLVNWFYILCGKLGFMLGLPDAVTYYLVQYSLIILFIVSIIVLFQLLLPKHLRRVAFLLTFFGGVFPFAEANQWNWTLQWESAYARLLHVPAHSFVEVLVVASWVSLIRLIRRIRHIRLIGLIAGYLTIGIIQFFAAIFFAPMVVPFLLAVVLTTFFYYVGRFSLGKNKIALLPISGIMIVVLSAVIGLWVMQTSIKSGNPGYQLQLSASVKQNFFKEATQKAIEYFRLFWLFMPFILLSIPEVYKGWKWEKLFVFVYFLTPFFLIFIAPFFGMESWRAANSMPLVTAGILTVVGINKLLKYLKSLQEIGKWAIVLVILAISFPQNLFYYQRELKPMFTTQVYLPNAEIEALTLLSKVAPPRAVVLSLESVADHIPMYSHARGYGTKDYDKRWYELGGRLDAEIEGFYRGTMTDEQAKNFLKRARISYVYFGWDEDDFTKEIKYKKFLKQIFGKSGIYLYEVAI